MSQSPLNAPGDNGETKPKKKTRKTACWSTIQATGEDLDDESFSTNNEEADDKVGGIPSLDREATFCLERFHISEELFASVAEL